MASAGMKKQVFEYWEAQFRVKPESAKTALDLTLNSMTDAAVAVAMDVLKKEYTGSFPPAPGMFRKWGQGDRPMLGSRLDQRKFVFWKDEEGRDLVYHSDMPDTRPPTQDELAAQEKLERSGVRDFAGLKPVIQAVNQQERGRSKDAS